MHREAAGHNIPAGFLNGKTLDNLSSFCKCHMKRTPLHLATVLVLSTHFILSHHPLPRFDIVSEFILEPGKFYHWRSCVPALPSPVARG